MRSGDTRASSTVITGDADDIRGRCFGWCRGLTESRLNCGRLARGVRDHSVMRIAALPLDLVFRFRLCGRLPLHVRRCIGATARERHPVIDHVPRPAARVARLAHEVLFRLLAALDPTTTGASTGRRRRCRSWMAHRRSAGRRGAWRGRTWGAPRRGDRRGTGFAAPLPGGVPRVRLDGLPGARRVTPYVDAPGVRARGG